MAEGTEKQVQSVEESVKTVHTISSNIDGIADNARQAFNTSIAASAKSSEGARAIEQAVTE